MLQRCYKATKQITQSNYTKHKHTTSRESNMRNIYLTAIVFVLITLGAFVSNTTKQTETFTITSMERINQSEGGGYYLVMTNKGAYKNTDSWFQLKFDSSDLQSTFIIGSEYTCTTNWFRVPILSMYRNIIECN